MILTIFTILTIFYLISFNIFAILIMFFIKDNKDFLLFNDALT